MINKFAARKQGEVTAIKNHSMGNDTVSDSTLFGMMGSKLAVTEV